MPEDGTWYNEQENKTPPCLLGLRKGGCFFFLNLDAMTGLLSFLHLILMALYLPSRIFQGKESKRMDKVGHTWHLNTIIVSRLLKTVTNMTKGLFYFFTLKREPGRQEPKNILTSNCQPFLLRILSKYGYRSSPVACPCFWRSLPLHLFSTTWRTERWPLRSYLKTTVKLFQPYKVTQFKNKPQFWAELLV